MPEHPPIPGFRNVPRTGAPVRIKASKRLRFAAGKGLKEAVNR